MLLSEWLRDNIEFVSALETPDESIPNEMIGTILGLEYGKRYLHEPITKLSGIEVASYINMRYNEKWNKVFDYLENSYDIGVVNSKEITENFDGNIVIDQSGNVVNKESAFNTDEFINSDSQDNELNNTNTTTNTRDRKEKYSSYHVANRQLINMNNESISNIIVRDIVNELCLKIY